MSQKTGDRAVTIAVRTTSAIKREAEAAALAERRTLSKWIERAIIAALRDRKGD